MGVGAAIVTTLSIPVITAGIEAIGANKDAKDAQDRADDAQDAADARAEANREHGRDMFEIQTEELDRQKEQTQWAYEEAKEDADRARRDISQQFKTVKEEYQDNTAALERSRKQAQTNLIRDSRDARQKSVSFGSRGGSVSSLISRRTDRFGNQIENKVGDQQSAMERQLESAKHQTDMARERIGDQLSDSKYALDQNLAQISSNRDKLDAGLKLSEAGYTYSVDMAQINNDAVHDQTRYSWVTGAVQGFDSGLSIGLNLYSLGTL